MFKSRPKLPWLSVRMPKSTSVLSLSLACAIGATTRMPSAAAAILLKTFLRVFVFINPNLPFLYRITLCGQMIDSTLAAELVDAIWLWDLQLRRRYKKPHSSYSHHVFAVSHTVTLARVTSAAEKEGLSIP